MVSTITFEVEFRTPVKPSTRTPGRLLRTILNTGAPSITVDSKRKPQAAAQRFVAQSGVGVGDGSFVGGDDVHAAREGRANVRNGGLAGAGIERSQFHRHVRARGVQERFHGSGGGTERRLAARRPFPRSQCRAAPYGFR